MHSNALSLCTCPVLMGWGSSPLGTAAEGQIPPSRFLRIAQSSNATATNIATNALDGVVGTASLTADVPGSF